MFDCYGDYKTFYHEPTQEEIKEAIHALLVGFAPLIEKKGTIYRTQIQEDGGPPKWTVGIKFFLPRKPIDISTKHIGDGRGIVFITECGDTRLEMRNDIILLRALSGHLTVTQLPSSNTGELLLRVTSQE